MRIAPATRNHMHLRLCAYCRTSFYFVRLDDNLFVQYRVHLRTSLQIKREV